MRCKYALSWAPCSSQLGVLDPIGDYSFALAHKVLEDPIYTGHYAAQKELFLDNSFHELGLEAPSIEALIEACELVDPMVVAAPDRIDDAYWTFAAFEEFRNRAANYGDWTVAASLCGSVEEMGVLYEKYIALFEKPEVLCLPYKCDRVGFLKALGTSHAPEVRRLGWHLYGYHDVTELTTCAALLKSFGVSNLTFDTAKPLTYAFRGVDFTESTVSGLCERPLEGYQLDHKQLLATQQNISRLRRWLAHVDWTTQLDRLRNRKDDR